MKKFMFRARDSNGRAIDGNIFAHDEEQATADLKAQKYQIEYLALTGSVLSFVQKREFFAIEGLATDFLKDIRNYLTRTPSESLAFFFRQLAILSRAGFNLKRSLDVMSKEVWPPHLLHALHEINRGISSGKQFSHVMEEHGHVFSPLYVTIISVGESSGNLLGALEKAAELSEGEAKIKKRISTALIYPGFMLSAFLVIIAGIIFYIIPQMEEVLRSLNMKLPWVISSIFAIIDFCRNPLVIIVAIEALLVLAFVYFSWMKKFNGRIIVDNALLRFPVLGPFLLNVSLARFAFNLNLLLESGVNLAKALDILPRAIGNESLAETIVEARKSLIGGSTLHGSLEQDRRFPRIFIQMLKVGEESGELPACVRNLCAFYEQEVEVALASFLGIFEPLLIIFMGLLVGGFFMAFLPMINQLYRGLT
jgi:type II secretory pathway component PulF